MNQWLADIFFALPEVLTRSYIFGSVCLGLCWLYYLFDIRGAICAAVRRSCGRAFWQKKLARRRDRLFYGAARKKAALDERGLYLSNLGAFCLLCVASAGHATLLYFCHVGQEAAVMADRILLTVAVVVVSVLALWTQPAATMERRTRWGFHRRGSLVRVVLRELWIVAVLFLWLYDAWFFSAII